MCRSVATRTSARTAAESPKRRNRPITWEAAYRWDLRPETLPVCDFIRWGVRAVPSTVQRCDDWVDRLEDSERRFHEDFTGKRYRRPAA